MFLSLSTDEWSAIGAAATALGSIVAAVALIAAFYGLRQNTRALNWQILEGLFKDVRELDRQHIADFESMTLSAKTAWSATFFNTVEYLCFVVNHKLAPTDTLKDFFFDQALPEWRKTFEKHVEERILGDTPDSFKEFKRATMR